MSFSLRVGRVHWALTMLTFATFAYPASASPTHSEGSRAQAQASSSHRDSEAKGGAKATRAPSAHEEGQARADADKKKPASKAETSPSSRHGRTAWARPNSGAAATHRSSRSGEVTAVVETKDSKTTAKVVLDAKDPKAAPKEAKETKTAANKEAKEAKTTTKSAPACQRQAVTISRHFGHRETESFALTSCEGKAAPGALEKLSSLARPVGISHAAPEPTRVPVKASLEIEPHGNPPVEHLLNSGMLTRIQAVASRFAGHPIEIHSGFVPWSQGSRHESGEALDIAVQGVPNEQLAAFCRTLPDTGCGYQPNRSYIHMDVRAPGAGHVYWVDLSGASEPSKSHSDSKDAKEPQARKDHDSKDSKEPVARNGHETKDSKEPAARKERDSKDSKEPVARNGHETKDSKEPAARKERDSKDTKEPVARNGHETKDSKEPATRKDRDAKDSKEPVARNGHETKDSKEPAARKERDSKDTKESADRREASSSKGTARKPTANARQRNTRR